MPKGWRMEMGGGREDNSFLPKGWRLIMGEGREDGSFLPQDWRMGMAGMGGEGAVPAMARVDQDRDFQLGWREEFCQLTGAAATV